MCVLANKRYSSLQDQVNFLNLYAADTDVATWRTNVNQVIQNIVSDYAVNNSRDCPEKYVKIQEIFAGITQLKDIVTWRWQNSQSSGSTTPMRIEEIREAMKHANMTTAKGLIDFQINASHKNKSTLIPTLLKIFACLNPEVDRTPSYAIDPDQIECYELTSKEIPRNTESQAEMEQLKYLVGKLSAQVTTLQSQIAEAAKPQNVQINTREIAQEVAAILKSSSQPKAQLNPPRMNTPVKSRNRGEKRTRFEESSSEEASVSYSQNIPTQSRPEQTTEAKTVEKPVPKKRSFKNKNRWTNVDQLAKHLRRTKAVVLQSQRKEERSMPLFENAPKKAASLIVLVSKQTSLDYVKSSWLQAKKGKAPWLVPASCYVEKWRENDDCLFLRLTVKDVPVPIKINTQFWFETFNIPSGTLVEPYKRDHNVLLKDRPKSLHFSVTNMFDEDYSERIKNFIEDQYQEDENMEAENMPRIRVSLIPKRKDLPDGKNPRDTSAYCVSISAKSKDLDLEDLFSETFKQTCPAAIIRPWRGVLRHNPLRRQKETREAPAAWN